MNERSCSIIHLKSTTQMILLKNGQILCDPQLTNKRTNEYLKQFWKLPSKRTLDQERQKIVSYDRPLVWPKMRPR